MPSTSKLAAFLTALSILFIGVAGTGTKLFFQWPGAAGIGLAALLAALLTFRHLRADVFKITLLSLLLLAGYLTARALTSEVDYLARQDLLLIALGVSGYLLGGWVFYRPGERLFLLAALGLLVLGNFAAALWQLKVDPEFTPYAWWGYARPTDGRTMGGFYVLHNHLAGLMGMTIPLAAALLVFSRRGAAFKAIVAVVLIAGILAVALSRSRGGVISLFAGLLVVAVLFLYLSRAFFPYHFRKIAGAAVVLLMVAGIPLAWFFSSQLTERFQSDSDAMTQNDTRWGLWEAALEQFQGAPWIGTGSRTFQYLVHKHWPEDLVHEQRPPLFTHNDYLQLLAEYGLVGGGLALLFLGIHLAAGMGFLADYRNRVFPAKLRWKNDQLAIVVGSLGGVSAMMVHSFVDFNLRSGSNLLCMSLLLGFLASPRSGERLPVDSLKGLRHLAVGGLAALTGGWLVWGAVRWFPAEVEMAAATRASMRGDRMVAMAHLKNMAAMDPSRYDVNASLARLHLDYGRGLQGPARQALLESFARKSVEAIDASLAEHPGQYRLWLLRGDAQTLLQEFDEAEASYRRALELAPMRGECHLSLGRFYYILGRFHESRGDVVNALANYERSKEELNQPLWAWESMETAKMRRPLFLESHEAWKALSQTSQNGP